jgi:signal transduction histidine kinase
VLDNAVKFTPAGGNIQVGVSAVEGAATVTVEDSGPGISEEQLPHIFERFYRSDSSRSRATGGFGLGLSIAKAIVDALHGSIHVESATQHGTSVEVTLPKA